MSGFQSYKVKTRLSKLVHRTGGKSRADAISAATRNLLAARDGYIETIEQQIDLIERTVSTDAPVSDRLRLLNHLSNNLITLAGTFGFDPLAEACMRLCDLTAAFLERDRWEDAPIAVHVRTIRVLAPGSTETVDPTTLLAGLRALLAHYDIAAGPSFTSGWTSSSSGAAK
ncbi:MAG: hypothetical protein JSR60_09430 [Proteobacteria bacterium]|nr:hypothetical protein [Pseudomonadota bacterium]